MEINSNYINDYKEILEKTNLQRGYQEFIKFFRYLRTYLEKEMSEYIFANNIVENNMDYSYFQFTNEKLKSDGLKIVVTFVHKDFKYEVWLSGSNRKIQCKYYDIFKTKKQIYMLTNNPNKTDYILKTNIMDTYNYDELDELLIKMKANIIDFIENATKVLF